MTTLRGFVLSCVSDRSHEVKYQTSNLPTSVSTEVEISEESSDSGVKFGVPLNETLHEDCLPASLVEMLIYIAQEGATTSDLFRRSGNPSDAKVIMKQMAEGKSIEFSKYNFYTLASVVKKFLLKIPGGIFGSKAEARLIAALSENDHISQFDEIHRIITDLPPASQQLLSLLFGTWFRIVSHSEYNCMSSEALAKSVAGSLFHTCAVDPTKIGQAVHVLQILIDNFDVASLFGQSNIQYFTDASHTRLNVLESLKHRKQKQPKEVEESIVIASTGEESYTALQQCVSTKNSTISVPTNCSSHNDYQGYSSPPSPHSLQTSFKDMPSHTAYSAEQPTAKNGHLRLVNVSSLSAPEVNKSYISSNDPSLCFSDGPPHSISTVNRSFEITRRRQLMRMRKRSNWFLSPDSQSPKSRSPSSRSPTQPPNPNQLCFEYDTQASKSQQSQRVSSSLDLNTQTSTKETSFLVVNDITSKNGTSFSKQSTVHNSNKEQLPINHQFNYKHSVINTSNENNSKPDLLQIEDKQHGFSTNLCGNESVLKLNTNVNI